MMSNVTVLSRRLSLFFKFAFIGRLGEQLHSWAEGRFPFCLVVRITRRRKEKHRIYT